MLNNYRNTQDQHATFRYLVSVMNRTTTGKSMITGYVIERGTRLSTYYIYSASIAYSTIQGQTKWVRARSFPDY